jgi:hypothetical protein
MQRVAFGRAAFSQKKRKIAKCDFPFIFERVKNVRPDAFVKRVLSAKTETAPTRTKVREWEKIQRWEKPGFSRDLQNKGTRRKQMVGESGLEKGVYQERKQIRNKWEARNQLICLGRKEIVTADLPFF